MRHFLKMCVIPSCAIKWDLIKCDLGRNGGERKWPPGFLCWLFCWESAQKRGNSAGWYKGGEQEGGRQRQDRKGMTNSDNIPKKTKQQGQDQTALQRQDRYKQQNKTQQKTYSENKSNHCTMTSRTQTRVCEVDPTSTHRHCPPIPPPSKPHRQNPKDTHVCGWACVSAADICVRSCHWMYL